MSEEDMQRTLVAEFPEFIVTDDRGTRTVQGFVEQVGTNVYLFETSIDLSGYAMMEKTFYPYSSFEQRNGAYIGTFTNTTSRTCNEAIIISSVPLDLSGTNANELGGRLPGFISGTSNDAYRLNRDVLIHQSQRLYAFDSTTSSTASSVYRLVSSNNASSLEPTAADRLYCYRLVFIAGEDGTLTVPAARVMLPGTIASEPTTEYLMRLKRSYELANQV